MRDLVERGVGEELGGVGLVEIEADVAAVADLAGEYLVSWSFPL